MEVLKAKTKKVILTSALLVWASFALFSQNQNIESGIIHRKAGQIDSAFFFLQIGMAEMAPSCPEHARAQYQLGICCDLIGEFARAEDYYTKSFATYQSQSDSLGMATVQKCLGASYSKQGKLPEAITQYNAALDYEIKHSIFGEAARTIQNIGIIHKKRGELSESINLYHQARRITIQHESDPLIICSVYNNLGTAHMQAGNVDSALYYHHKRLSVARKYGAGDMIRLTYDNLQRSFSQTGQWDSAYYYCAAYTALSDSLRSQKSEDLIQELQAKYEAAEAEATIRSLEVSQANDRFRFAFIVLIILVVSAVITLVFWRQKTLAKVRASAIVHGRELEGQRIAQMLNEEVAATLNITKDQLPSDFKDANQSIDSAIAVVKFVANLEHNQFLKFGLRQALEALIQNIKNERFVVIEAHLDDVDIDMDKRVSAYKIIEALLINTFKFQDAGTTILKVQHRSGRLTISNQANSTTAYNSNLYQAVKGRVYEMGGQLKTSQDAAYTKTEIEIQTHK